MNTTLPESANRYTLENLNALWAALSDTPVSECGMYLDEAFMGFGVGESVMSVWGWFEAQHPEFVVGTAVRKFATPKQKLDNDTLHDFVVAHGLGEPTPSGYRLAAALHACGDDYSTIAAEIVSYGLTCDASDDEALLKPLEQTMKSVIEVHNIPVISTAHLTATTADTLTRERGNNPWCIAAAWECGYFLYLGELLDDAPQCLHDVAQWLKKHNFNLNWVRLDSDGEQQEDLHTYDW